MFEVGKPRQFHYEPRFYDPGKEKLEALKKKYEYLRGTKDRGDEADTTDIQYYERRLRDLDEEKRVRNSRLTWRDMFRKREMPRFHYEPRFSGMQATAAEGEDTPANSDPSGLSDASDDLIKKYAPRHQIKIKRRYDITDPDYMKPMPAHKILLYAGIVCILILAIFFL